MLNWVNENVVWGIPTLLLFIGCGVYFTIKLRGFQFRLLPLFRETLFKRKKGSGFTPLKSFCTSLATTLGTGNIIAVGTAVAAGGAGAVFWMWLSAFLGMATCYCENYLGMKYRSKTAEGYEGGAFNYIRKAFGTSVPAVLYAVFCVLASFGMGNMAQLNTMSASLEESFGIPVWISGISAAGIVALLAFGGLSRLGSITQRAVPIISAAYIIGCLVVIGFNIGSLPSVFVSIFSEAFSPRSVSGGIIGSVMLNSMSWGLRRGIFSNEAGLGSSVMLHASSTETNPSKQGLWASLQVFFDTIVICTMTALAILVSRTHLCGDGSGSAAAAFETVFGNYASCILSTFIFFFAVSTAAGWSVYGSRCVSYLLGKKAKIPYLVLFVFAAFLGSVSPMETVWQLSDIFNGLMAVPNLISVLLLRREIGGVDFSRRKGYNK